MTIHQTTFARLIDDTGDLRSQLADFFEDAASTYRTLSKRLRRGAYL